MIPEHTPAKDFPMQQTLTISSTGSVNASLTTNMTGANNDVVLTARDGGTAGNAITLALIDPAGNDAALDVNVTGGDIVASLATGPGGAITTTASQLLAAIAADSAANALVSGALKTGNSGAGVVTALAETPLAGGAQGAGSQPLGLSPMRVESIFIDWPAESADADALQITNQGRTLLDIQKSDGSLFNPVLQKTGPTGTAIAGQYAAPLVVGDIGSTLDSGNDVDVPVTFYGTAL
jgi:hypothetical protein